MGGVRLSSSPCTKDPKVFPVLVSILAAYRFFHLLLCVYSWNNCGSFSLSRLNFITDCDPKSFITCPGKIIQGLKSECIISVATIYLFGDCHHSFWYKVRCVLTSAYSHMTTNEIKT